MKIFVDANVLVAVLNREYPLFPYAARMLSLVDTGKYNVCISPVCLAIAFYFAEKKSGTKQARWKIALLTEKLGITTKDEEVVRLAATNPAVYDFEDGIQYYSAQLAGCTTIVTENGDDFYFSELPVLGCEAFLSEV